MWQQILISLIPGLLQLVANKGNSGSSSSGSGNMNNIAQLAALFGQSFQSAQNYQNQQASQQWQQNFAMNQFRYNQLLNDRTFMHTIPYHQVQQYIKAGLSPDLMTGQITGMDFGHSGSYSMPNVPSPQYQGLQDANLRKDLHKKDSEIRLNLSKDAVNKIDYAIKQIEEQYQQGTLNNRVELVFLEKEFKKIHNQLEESNVETNVINNIKLATSLGLVKSIDKDGNIIYSKTPKFKEICSYYLKEVKMNYDIKEQDLKNLEEKFKNLQKDLELKNSDILINSVAYQQEVLNLITSAVGSGVSLSQNEKGEWVVDYDGDSGDVAGIVTMGLIDSVLSAIGIKFTLGKNASKVLGEHKTHSTIRSSSTNVNTNNNNNKTVY